MTSWLSPTIIAMIPGELLGLLPGSPHVEYEWIIS